MAVSYRKVTNAEALGALSENPFDWVRGTNMDAIRAQNRAIYAGYREKQAVHRRRKC